METAQPCGGRYYCPHSTDEKAELGGLGELAQGCSALHPPVLSYPSPITKKEPMRVIMLGARMSQGRCRESRDLWGGRLGRHEACNEVVAIPACHCPPGVYWEWD